MSIAVAVHKNNDIVLATDSQTSMGQERVPVENFHDYKFLSVGDIYMATTGWSVYTNIINDWLNESKTTPPLHDESTIFRFFNTLWGRLHDRYHFVKDQEEDSESPFGSLDSSFLIIAETGIFAVAPDLAVSRIRRYFAIGAGAEAALGSMYTLYNRGSSATEIATTAVEAAIAHNIYCGLPINTITIKAQYQQPPIPQE